MISFLKSFFHKKEKIPKKAIVTFVFPEDSKDSLFECLDKLHTIASSNGVTSNLYSLESRTRTAVVELINSVDNPECYFNLAISELELLIELHCFDAEVTINKK